jgi:ATP-dependent Lhr-like helicase
VPTADALVADWFASRGWTPFDFQREAWDAFRAGADGLIHAATGTGKTYAAWLGPVLHWLEAHPVRGPVRRAEAAPLQVLWITPLRALAADTAKALAAPLADLQIPWTIETRTGDTRQSIRAKQRERLPSALVTTPESLALLLTRPDAAELFAHLQAVVVDEWHELMGTKRGVQVELGLARLRRFRPDLRTWGVSATLGNLDEAMETLVGEGSPRRRRLVRGLVPKDLRIEAVIPDTMERFPWAGHLGTRLLDAVVDEVERATTTLVFTNTRSQSEIWYQALLAARPDWAGLLAIHHGSLDRRVRDFVEDGIRNATLKCVVCTSSLDLGVDFAPVDCVMQVGSPKGVARLLQRAGRSGHQPGRPSRILCVPTHAFELVEVAAAREAAAVGAIESRPPLRRPLDLLAQHAVTLAVGGGFTREAFAAEVRTTRAYRDLSEAELDWTLDFVVRGGDALKAYDEYARVTRDGDRFVVTDARTARRHRMAIGTIVSDAAIAVRLQSGGTLGTVEESFAARLKAGDRFIFAGKPLEFIRLRDMVCCVKRARTAKGAVPRWMGARMPLSSELALAVRRKLDEARTGRFDGPEMAAVRPILELQAAWSCLPAPDELLIERCATREGHHLFVYPLDGRLVHEGLAALFAYRIAQLGPISFTFACNDYGFELLSPEPAPIDEALEAGLLATAHLAHDVVAALNAAEMARRQFREVARVAGLIFQGFPGQGKTVRQLQVSSGLLYDVFTKYDPANLLVQQARREVLEQQLEQSRLAATLARLERGRVRLLDVERPTPLAFPLLVDRTREKLSTEQLVDRVRRMTVALERAAAGAATRRAPRR